MHLKRTLSARFRNVVRQIDDHTSNVMLLRNGTVAVTTPLMLQQEQLQCTIETPTQRIQSQHNQDVLEIRESILNWLYENGTATNRFTMFFAIQLFDFVLQRIEIGDDAYFYASACMRLSSKLNAKRPFSVSCVHYMLNEKSYQLWRYAHLEKHVWKQLCGPNRSHWQWPSDQLICSDKLLKVLRRSTRFKEFNWSLFHYFCDVSYYRSRFIDGIHPLVRIGAAILLTRFLENKKRQPAKLPNASAFCAFYSKL